ncbi:unnamed protein product [Parnassius apollo]|uniref:(apollo) hypothetical protein n=1 Tax=Parnassius apollo TaxID=110799 RepID=A0A8S3Y265_PARAO|nr:unnamed protein product [Parnassius apollo]
MHYYYLVNQAAVTKRNPKKRRFWMIKMHADQIKNDEGRNLLADLIHEPSGQFDNFCRMSSSDFEFLLQKIGPAIAKKNSRGRQAIPIKVRLAVTLSASSCRYNSGNSNTCSVEQSAFGESMSYVRFAIGIARTDTNNVGTRERRWIQFARPPTPFTPLAFVGVWKTDTSRVDIGYWTQCYVYGQYRAIPIHTLVYWIQDYNLEPIYPMCGAGMKQETC